MAMKKKLMCAHNLKVMRLKVGEKTVKKLHTYYKTAT